MTYEVIRNIENNCKQNQMRDVFFEEIETDDPDLWIRQMEPCAMEILREELPGGIRGAESMGELYNAMLRRNWSEDTVRDIFWNNLFQFFGRVM